MKRTTASPASDDSKHVVPNRKLELPTIADQLALASSSKIFADPTGDGGSLHPWHDASPITAAEDLDLKHLLLKKKKERDTSEFQPAKKKIPTMERTTSLTAMMRTTSYVGSTERGKIAENVLSIMRSTRKNSFRKLLPSPKSSNHNPTKGKRGGLIKSICRMRRPASSPGPLRDHTTYYRDDDEVCSIKPNLSSCNTATKIRDSRSKTDPVSVALHGKHQNHLKRMFAAKQEDNSSKQESMLENNDQQRIEEEDLFANFWESLVELIFPPWEVDVCNNEIPTTVIFSSDQGESSTQGENKSEQDDNGNRLNPDQTKGNNYVDDNETDDGAPWNDDGRETTTLGDDSGESNSVNYELDRLSFDLDSTQRSLVDLESEFEEDLEALSLGIETAFNQPWFDEEDDDEVDLEGMLRRQESQLSQSTRSNFRSSEQLTESFRSVKRKRRNNSAHTVVLEMELLKAEEEETPQEEEKQLEELIEEFWIAIEWYFQQYVNYYFFQEQEDPGSATKSFLQLWLELS